MQQDNLPNEFEPIIVQDIKPVEIRQRPVNEYSSIFLDYPPNPSTLFENVISILEEVNLPDSVWVAGGFVLGVIAPQLHHPNDIDFFFKDSSSLSKTLRVLPKRGYRHFNHYPLGTGANRLNKLIANTKAASAITVTTGDWMPIQLVKHSWHESVAHLLGSFDLNVCQFATNGENIYWTDAALSSLKTRVLTLNRIQNHTLFRMSKYDHFYPDEIDVIRAIDYTLQNKDSKNIQYGINMMSENKIIPHWMIEAMKLYNVEYSFGLTIGEFLKKVGSKSE